MHLLEHFCLFDEGRHKVLKLFASLQYLNLVISE